MQLSNSWTYEQVQPTLEQTRALIEAAELHGLQCGLYIKNPAQNVAVLSPQIEREAAAQDGPQMEAVIEGLFAQIKSQLSHLECDFQLLLPHDDSPLDDRVRALSRWCHGFLYGLKLGGLEEAEMANGLSLEAFKVLMDVASWHSRTTQTEEDEKALFELIEFVRMAVQTLYIELNAELWGTTSVPEAQTWH